jgi:hypothetical protein
MSIAGVAMRRIGLPCSLANFCRKWSASSRMSGFRSRSGGTKMVKTLRR